MSAAFAEADWTVSLLVGNSGLSIDGALCFCVLVYPSFLFLLL